MDVATRSKMTGLAHAFPCPHPTYAGLPNTLSRRNFNKVGVSKKRYLSWQWLTLNLALIS